MGESKEKAALNMAFSQTHLPPESSNPPSPSPTPKQKVLTEQTSKDPTPRSRAVRLVWGGGVQCGLTKARNIKVEPSHLLPEAEDGHPSFVFYCSARKD